MNTVGRYIYGVINFDREEFFDLDEIVSFEDIYPSRSHAEVVESSKNSNCAYTISFQDIAAIVSDSEIVDYSHIPKDTLGRLLVSHQQLIEKVMTKHSIIPMRLGTFAQNDEEVKEILASGYRTIKDIFERAKNSIEIDVVATLNDFKSFLREVSEEKEIKQLKQSLLNKDGGVTIDDQMKIGVLVKKHLDKKKEILANQIQTALSEIAQNLKAHDLMDDKMVLNTAFLIDKNRQEEFEQKLDHINDEFEDKLNFRFVGPLPPYSFYTLEVKKPQFEEIDWAKKKLGLKDDFITAIEIKKAHRRTALVCHPDKNPDTPDIEKKFDEMTRAYRILLDYYRASNQAESGEGCYINEEAFEKNAVLVTTMG
ncbi:MAG: GvpL/GvpF family gas vesicle protein [Planctomycetota bacterium]